MVPQFNGGAYSPVTPNNGNPNTVYNQPRQDDQAIPYMPAFEQPFGGGEMRITAAPGYGPEPVLPEQAVKPVGNVAPDLPMNKPTAGVQPVFGNEQAVKPTVSAGMPSFSKPPVPEIPSLAKPPARDTNPFVQFAQGPATNQVSLAGYNNMSRSPYSLTLEQPPEPTGRISVNTMYSDGLRSLMSELTSLQRPVATIPIPGVTQPTQPTQPGTTTPTQPGTTNPIPIGPRLPGVATGNTGVLNPDNNLIGRDVVDYGRRAEVANGFGSGNFTGIGSLLGLQGQRATMFDSRVTDIYNGMYPEQRAVFTDAAATINNPDAPEEEKQSAWERIKAFLGREWESFKDDLRNPGRFFRDPSNWLDMAVPGAGMLWDAISRNQYANPDTRPITSTGTVTVGQANQAPRPNIPVQPIIRTPMNPDGTPGTPAAPSGGNASGGGSTGSGGVGSTGGMTGAGGSSRIVNPWDQKPGSRLPRRPS